MFNMLKSRRLVISPVFRLSMCSSPDKGDVIYVSKSGHLRSARVSDSNPETLFLLCGSLCKVTLSPPSETQYITQPDTGVAGQLTCGRHAVICDTVRHTTVTAYRATSMDEWPDPHSKGDLFHRYCESTKSPYKTNGQ